MSLKLPKLQNHTCLTAGAGAGKTRRLVETYLGLLAGGIKPQQIVAITFTEKAAAEMRSRVVAQLAQLAAAGEPGPDWRRLLPQVEWAPISTIHSFCASLLREFGAVMGLDPEFSVMEADEFQEIKEEILDQIIREEMQAASARLLELSAQFPLMAQGGLRQRIIYLHSELSSLGVSPARARQRTAEAHVNEAAAAPGLLSELNGVIGQLAAKRAGELASGKQKFLAKLDSLLDEWPNLYSKLQADPADLESLQMLFSHTGGNWGKVNELRQKCRKNLEDLISMAALPLGARLADLLLELTGELDSRLEQELKRRASLDFDGLLLGARALVRDNPSVLSELKGRWSALLVDEYQDVNPVQGELVRLLAGLQGPKSHAGGADQPAPRLMVVGDRKQSIYAFRGAEVSLYAQTMEEFESGDGVLEALPNNWRSAHQLVEFFNSLFPQVFSGGKHRQSNPAVYVDYRDDDAQQPARQRPGPSHGAVEVLLTDGPEDLSSEAWRREEANSLGQYIRGLIQEHGVEPGEIAVLFRRLTQAGLYEEGLNQAGVSYYTLRGRGYYGCQEIKDIYYTLRAASNNKDELALAVWLRSPMVGLSDETLLAISHPGPGAGNSLNQALTRGGPWPDWLTAQDRNSIELACNNLKNLNELAKRLSPAELVEAIIEQSGYLPVMMGTPGGEQKAANLRKLLEMSRQPGWGLRGGVEEFILGLGKLVESPPQEPKAPLLGEEAQVVRLMTVHQSKGLEFPIVILADLGGKDMLFSALPPPAKNGLISVAPRDSATDALIKNQIYSNLRAKEQASQEAELARLFYVACTRATEKLIFSLTTAPPNKQSAWGGWVHNLVINNPQANIINASEEFKVIPKQFQVRANTSEFETAKSASQTKSDPEAHAIAQRCLQPRGLPVKRLQESVSGIEDWFACPRRYYFTRILGMDTAVLSGSGPNGGFGANLGSQVHRLLELAPLWEGPSGLDGVLHQTAPPGDAARVRDLAAGVWRTELNTLLEDLPPRNILREQGFNLSIALTDDEPRLDIIGEIDLLLAHPDGNVVVDYKVSGHMDPAPYRLQLSLYALAAWRMLGKSGPPPRCGICYLHDRGSKLIWQEIEASGLENLEMRLQSVAREIAALPLSPRLEDFPGALNAIRAACWPGPICARRVWAMAEQGKLIKEGQRMVAQVVRITYQNARKTDIPWPRPRSSRQARPHRSGGQSCPGSARGMELMVHLRPQR
jgi:ATP-dependent helicase/nuclease subunit A